MKSFTRPNNVLIVSTHYFSSTLDCISLPIQIYSFKAINCTNLLSNYSPQVGSRPYTVYHSIHDNYYWMTHFGDPTFTHHLAIGLLWIFTALSLTNSPLLPCKATDYGLAMEDILKNFQQDYHQVLEQNGISIGKYCNHYSSKFMSNRQRVKKECNPKLLQEISVWLPHQKEDVT